MMGFQVGNPLFPGVDFQVLVMLNFRGAFSVTVAKLVLIAWMVRTYHDS